jgi:hypothetical protein
MMRVRRVRRIARCQIPLRIGAKFGHAAFTAKIIDSACVLDRARRVCGDGHPANGIAMLGFSDDDLKRFAAYWPRNRNIVLTHGRACCRRKIAVYPKHGTHFPLPAFNLTWVKRSAESVALGGMKARTLKFFGPRTTALTKELLCGP